MWRVVGWTGVGIGVVAVMRRALFRVSGRSMRETAPNGSWLIVDWITCRLRRPKPGDIVVVRWRREGVGEYIVKRVLWVREAARPKGTGRLRAKETEVFVQGEGPHSVDSRQFGFISSTLIEGYALAVVRPPDGRLGSTGRGRG